MCQESLAEFAARRRQTLRGFLDTLKGQSPFLTVSVPLPQFAGGALLQDSGNQAISRMAACAAARRAMGTRKGLQDT